MTLIPINSCTIPQNSSGCTLEQRNKAMNDAKLAGFTYAQIHRACVRAGWKIASPGSVSGIITHYRNKKSKPAAAAKPTKSTKGDRIDKLIRDLELLTSELKAANKKRKQSLKLMKELID
jgi:hypothetical protein